MPQTTTPMTKPEAYDAYRNGNLTESEAREIFGTEWEDVLQLERVENILDAQPDPETDSDDLLL